MDSTATLQRFGPYACSGDQCIEQLVNKLPKEAIVSSESNLVFEWSYGDGLELGLKKPSCSRIASSLRLSFARSENKPHWSKIVGPFSE